MAKRRDLFKIDGTAVSVEREQTAPQLPGSWTGDARGSAHACPDCGTPTSRDDSLPAPFDVMCEACLWIRNETMERIERSLQSVRDVEETGVIFVPIRPLWPSWRRSS